MVFRESAAKVAVGFFSEIKISKNTAFDHVTEVPKVIYQFMEWSLHLELTFKWRDHKINIMQECYTQLCFMNLAK